MTAVKTSDPKDQSEEKVPTGTYRAKNVQATFIGSAGKASLGFHRNRSYRLKIEQNVNFKEGNIFVCNLADPALECQYESMLAFLDNWDNINNI